MALKDQRKAIKDLYTKIFNEVEDDLYSNFVNIIELNVNTFAAGLRNGAKNIPSTSKAHIPAKINKKKNWVDAVDSVFKAYSKNIQKDMKLSTLRRRVNTKVANIKNAFVLNYTPEVSIEILIQKPGPGGSMRADSVMIEIRKACWQAFRNKHMAGTPDYFAGTAQKELGLSTPHSHIGPTTRGFYAFEQMEDRYQQSGMYQDTDVKDTFDQFGAFAGQYGLNETVDVFAHIKGHLNSITWQNTSYTDPQTGNSKFERVVVANVDLKNKRGSDKFDKTPINKEILSYLDGIIKKIYKTGKFKALSKSEAAKEKTSDSYNERTKKLISNIVAIELDNAKNLKSVKKIDRRRKKVNTKNTFKNKSAGKAVTTKALKGRVNEKAGKRSAPPGKGANPLALKELINAALPEEILERMNPPALRNRTGRFRRSAQVTNVLVGPRGGVEAEYTYMKMPYQTFEPGYAQGSTYRDPRKIIGESVREIAQKLTGNRFIKVRRI